MARWQLMFLLALILAALGRGNVMAAGPLSRQHVEVDLVAEKLAAEPGRTLTVAIREKIQPGWHTYWINPGDSGEPTSIDWTLRGGLTAGPILWPLPHTIQIGPLTNYGYENEVLLLTDIQIPREVSGNEITLAAKVTYLVCKDICVPEESHVTLTLPISASPGPSEFAGQIEEARNALPIPLNGTAIYAVNSAKEALRLSVMAGTSLFQGVSDARFFPLAWGSVSNSAVQPFKIVGGELTVDLKQGDTKETPDELGGVLVLKKSDGEGPRHGYLVVAKRWPNSASAGSLFDRAATGGSGNAAPSSGAFQYASGGVGIAVLFAFLGGIILNLMPCVFPVLAIKALGFANAKDGGHRQQGYAYLCGVLVSFAALAAAIAAFREGSAALGWGFQFQSPTFVLALAILFFVMGLSLSGVVSFGGSFMSAGGRFANKPGNAGYFFTGVLAAVAATPCTAPFMGAAIGYAVTQPFYVLLSVMLALGLGFAAPVFFLSVSPAMQRILPKPGNWMETLKQVLAFPLYATVGWLIWVLSIQAGSDGVMAAALSLIGVAFAAWLSGKTAFSSLPLKLVAPTFAVIAIAIGLSMATAADTSDSSAGSEAALPNEGPFTQGRLDALKAEGKPVFVNLTAAWCITCKVNERVALRTNKVAQAFRSAGITYLKGDWTRANPEITALLEHFGRAGVPLYLYYPPNGAEPRILPQLLTAGILLDEIKSQSAASEGAAKKGA
jgi:thiol:disulfide interchange protein/DsbC/DsbD-like thiol-disulfide interchange protein